MKKYLFIIPLTLFLFSTLEAKQPKYYHKPYCQDSEFLEKAKESAKILNEDWYKSSNGQWVGTVKGPNDYWWHSANTLTALMDTMIITNSFSQQRNYLEQLRNTFSKGMQTRNNFINDYYDDAMWWGLNWIKAYKLSEYGVPITPQEKQEYLDVCKEIFEKMINHAWSEEAPYHGGMWWSTRQDYKNAVSTLLFITFAGRLAQIDGVDPKYFEWAKKAWEWFEQSGMILDNNVVKDGLDGNGNLRTKRDDPKQVVWTYNQGLLIASVTALYLITQENSYLNKAIQYADAGMKYLSQNQEEQVLQEECEHKTQCIPNPNSGQFKGIFMRCLIELVEVLPKIHPARKRFEDFIYSNVNSLLNNNQQNGYFGHFWTGPYNGKDPIYQTSALDLLNAAARIDLEYKSRKKIPFIRLR